MIVKVAKSCESCWKVDEKKPFLKKIPRFYVSQGTEVRINGSENELFSLLQSVNYSSYIFNYIPEIH